MQKVEVVTVPLSKLVPADYNPRNIGELNFNALKKSLEKFGMPQPIIVNRRSGVIVGGHQRLKAAKDLGWESVPVVYVDLSEPQEKALNVSLNSNKLEGFFTDDLHAFLTDLKTDLPEDDFKDLRLDDLMESTWDADLDKIDSINESDELPEGVIKINCPNEIKDEVLIFLKAKFLETSFEGIHIE